MPSKSKKQHNLMEAVAHSPAFAKKVGIPQSVGKEFSEADKNKKFTKGGGTMATMNPMMARRMMMAKKAGMGAAPAPVSPGMGMMKKGGTAKKPVKKMASGGMAKSSMGSVKTNTKAPHGDGIAERGKTRAMMPKMGGSTTGMKKGGKVKC
jgi:hypothetical protein